MNPAGGPERSRWLLPASFLAALAFRLVGLGGSSMWHDEILETLMARGDLRHLLSGLLFDKAQPPVEPLLTWVLIALDMSETSRRIVSLIFGAAAILFCARWVERRFGTATAATAALFLASSPILVRYAHELRPYALALLLSAWALDAADRWIERGSARFPLELVLAASLASMTHYLAVALWVPVAASYLEARLEGRVGPSVVWRHGAAVLLSLLPLAAWFALLALRGGPRQLSPVTVWSFDLVERRLEDLLLRGYAGQEVSGLSLLLFAILVTLGFAVTAKRRGGFTLMAGLFAGTVLVELALLAAERFSHERYNLFGLLFLHIAMAAGVVAFARSVARWNRLSGAITGGMLAAAVVATSFTGLIGYAQHGRPDWAAVARAVRALEGSEAHVAASIPWAQISAGYYLDRYNGGWPQEPRAVELLANDRKRLQRTMAEAAGCRLVLVAAHPRDESLIAGFRPERPVLRHAETDEVELYRFAGEGTPESDCLPPAGFRFELSPGYGELFPWSRG